MAPVDEKQTPQPTSAEAYLFYSIVKNLRTRPDIDWEGVARDNGFKNAETAKVRYGQVKRKLQIEKWSPPVKPHPGTAKPKANASGVGKTEPDDTPIKLGAATGAGVKKRTPATSARKTAVKAKGKNVDSDSDDSEGETKAVIKTPNNAVGAAAANPISIDSSTPTTGDSNDIRPVRNISAVLARLSPTPIGRAEQNQINIDNFISSFQSPTPPATSSQSFAQVNNNSRPQSVLPPPGVPMPGSVYEKTAIPIRGLGNTWTAQPISQQGHHAWFGGLSVEDQNRFMEAAVQYHVDKSNELGIGLVSQQHQNNGGGSVFGGHQNGTPAQRAAASAAAQFKGKKLADIPYHPDFQGGQDQDGEDDIGIH